MRVFPSQDDFERKWRRLRVSRAIVQHGAFRRRQWEVEFDAAALLPVANESDPSRRQESPIATTSSGVGRAYAWKPDGCARPASGTSLAKACTMLRHALGASLLLNLLVGCQRSNGSASEPDGSPPVADGSGALPDGSSAHPDGSPPDGSSALTDGPPPVADGMLDRGVCAPNLVGPTSTEDSPRRTVPWTLVLAADGGVPGSDAGSSGAAGAVSGCTTSPARGIFFQSPSVPDDVACNGTVAVRRAGSALDLIFADGSILRWDTTVIAPVVSAPTVADGQTASVSYSQRTTLVCPACGYYPTTELQIRTAGGGPLIWVGRQGATLDEVGPDIVQELFGAGSRSEPACHSTFTAGCFNVMREVFDHVLETTPEQGILAAISRHITTPKGEYDVFWTHSRENSVRMNNCNDGAGVASDNSFAASRTTGPPTN